MIVPTGAATRSRLPGRCGPIRQLAFVPQDFDAALRLWVETMGVGPFFYLEHIPLENVRYRGELIEYDCSAAIAYWGDLEIELLRQHNDSTSILTQWLRDGREGVHHIRVEVEDIEEARTTFLERGANVVQEASLPGSGAYIMFDMRGPGPIVEVSWLHTRFKRLFAFIKCAARDWDGRDPLRSVPPEEQWG